VVSTCGSGGGATARRLPATRSTITAATAAIAAIEAIGTSLLPCVSAAGTAAAISAAIATTVASLLPCLAAAAIASESLAASAAACSGARRLGRRLVIRRTEHILAVGGGWFRFVEAALGG